MEFASSDITAIADLLGANKDDEEPAHQFGSTLNPSNIAGGKITFSNHAYFIV